MHLSFKQSMDMVIPKPPFIIFGFYISWFQGTLMSHESKDLQMVCGIYVPMNSKCSEHHGGPPTPPSLCF
jgi:hypothetical protein